LAAGLAGLALQYTVKDRLPILAVVFYALPPLVVVVATLLSVGLLSRRSSWWWVALSVGAAILAVITWMWTDHARAGPVAPAGDLRIVFWNGAHPRMPTPLAGALKTAGGQVVVLAEAGHADPSCRRMWQSLYPNHAVTFLPGSEILLSAYPVSKIATHRMGRRTRVHTCVVTTPGGPLSLVVVDVESELLSNRGPLIARVYELAASLPTPTIVLGDFNTPHTSSFFTEFRRSFQHAFESSGSGLIPTWPALLPVLDLDHVWLSRDIVPVHARTLRTFRSDHAMLIADVNLPAAAE